MPLTKQKPQSINRTLRATADDSLKLQSEDNFKPRTKVAERRHAIGASRIPHVAAPQLCIDDDKSLTINHQPFRPFPHRQRCPTTLLTEVAESLRGERIETLGLYRGTIEGTDHL